MRNKRFTHRFPREPPPILNTEVRHMRTWLIAIGCASLCLSSLAAEDEHGKFTANLNHIKQIASTVPSNGDVNPYGVAVVPRSTGALVEGDILVSNFNNSAN